MADNGMDERLNRDLGGVLDRQKIDQYGMEQSLSIEGFDPFPGHILVEPIPPDEMIGRLYIPEQAREPKAIGFVRRVSSADRSFFVPGDLALFAKDTGDDLMIEGRAMKILTFSPSKMEGDILGRWPLDKLPAGMA